MIAYIGCSFSRNNCVGMARIVTPHLTAEHVQYRLLECKEKLDSRFLYQFVN